jgi:putative MATE family efflux protein
VGLNDTYLANTLPSGISRDATAAVGTIAYILWFIGLLVGTVGAGSTAIIARAKGARHRSLANSVTGQSITSGLLLGLGLGLVMYLGAGLVVKMTQLIGRAPQFAESYLRWLAWGMPAATVLFVANACLRGAGDTITPAITMVVVDVVNVICTWGLTRGLFGLPELGFEGISLGTLIAYVTGGVIQFGVLVFGRRGVRLYLHRLRPHWVTLKRLLRIGLPAGAEGLLAWLANFAVVIVVNRIGSDNTAPAAHVNAIRIEAVSFLAGFAVAMAAATMVGQSLGQRNPRRAVRSAYLAYAVGGGIMTLMGLCFVLFGQYPARWLSPHDAHIADLTARCLFVAGLVQSGFAASAIFGGALRGAGDTTSVMLLNLASILGVRLSGVLVVGLWLNLGLVAVWVVLCVELMVRGTLVWLWFLRGSWKRIQV